MPYRDRDTHRAYQRAWCARRRAGFLAGRCCAQCGAADELEFYHVDPATKLSHRIWGWSLARIEAELAKCVVLCDSCHNALHMTARHGGQLSVFGGVR